MCDENIDDCFGSSTDPSHPSNPCQNGGQCIDQIDDFVCECLPGFTGKKCQVHVFFICFLIFISSVRKVSKYFQFYQSYFDFLRYSMTLTSVKETHARMEEHAPVAD